MSDQLQFSKFFIRLWLAINWIGICLKCTESG